MRRLVGTSLLLAAFLAVSATLHAQDKDKKKDAPAPLDSAKLSPGEFIGTLKTTPGSDRVFVMTVEIKRLVPTGKNPGAYRGNNANASRVLNLQNKINNDQVQMAKARNPKQYQQYQQNLARDVQQLQQAVVQLLVSSSQLPPGYKIATQKQDVEFQASEAVKVRTMILPEEFDDKGNVKKYTKDELAEKKGKDKNLPGYESSLETLEPKMKVRVVLAAAPKKKAEAKDKDKEKEKDADKDKGKEKDAEKDKDKEKEKDKDELKDTEKKMQVKQIYILEEAPATSQSQKDKKQK